MIQSLYVCNPSRRRSRLVGRRLRRTRPATPDRTSCSTGSPPPGCAGRSSARSATCRATAPRAPRCRARGLGAVGTFVFDDLHDPAARERGAARGRRGDRGDRRHRRHAARPDRPAERRAGRDRRALARRAAAGRGGVGRAGRRRPARRRARGDRGVRAVLHPHAGGYVEFEDEIERLLDAVPADELGLCLDTGHALYAGSDPAELLARYGERVEHLHLKDVAGARAARGLGLLGRRSRPASSAPSATGCSTSRACAPRSTATATTASRPSSRTACPAPPATRPPTCARSVDAAAGGRDRLTPDPGRVRGRERQTNGAGPRRGGARAASAPRRRVVGVGAPSRGRRGPRTRPTAGSRRRRPGSG